MFKIKDDIYWVGIKDWELRHFHGQELSTHRGSTYNSYVVKDEKTVLIDTVWYPYKEEFVERLERDVGLDNIDMIVINHMEPDHGGSLEYLLSKMNRDVPIYCTKNGAITIKEHFHRDWNFKVVKTGDRVSIGKYDLVFVEMTMLHWPDSMLTYVDGAAVAFSSDAFGQHYSGKSFFNDEVDSCELHQEALKYYANILQPFSVLVKKKIEEIRAMNLDLDIIAPAHGVIWRENPGQIIDKYYEYCNMYKEDYIVIIYDTMYEATATMARIIENTLIGLGHKVKLFNGATTDRSDLHSEIFKAKALLIGSCTVNNSILRSIGSILDEIRTLKVKGKTAAAFGSYGWSGEGADIISASLEKSGLKVTVKPVKARYRPDGDEVKSCENFAREFAGNI